MQSSRPRRQRSWARADLAPAIERQAFRASAVYSGNRRSLPGCVSPAFRDRLADVAIASVDGGATATPRASSRPTGPSGAYDLREGRITPHTASEPSPLTIDNRAPKRALGAAAKLDRVLDLVDRVMSPREARPEPNDRRTPASRGAEVGPRLLLLARCSRLIDPPKTAPIRALRQRVPTLTRKAKL